MHRPINLTRTLLQRLAENRPQRLHKKCLRVGPSPTIFTDTETLPLNVSDVEIPCSSLGSELWSIFETRFLLAMPAPAPASIHAAFQPPFALKFPKKYWGLALVEYFHG